MAARSKDNIFVSYKREYSQKIPIFANEQINKRYELDYIDYSRII